jgi:hypothetical protein
MEYREYEVPTRYEAELRHTLLLNKPYVNITELKGYSYTEATEKVDEWAEFVCSARNNSSKRLRVTIVFSYAFSEGDEIKSVVGGMAVVAFADYFLGNGYRGLEETARTALEFRQLARDLPVEFVLEPNSEKIIYKRFNTKSLFGNARKVASVRIREVNVAPWAEDERVREASEPVVSTAHVDAQKSGGEAIADGGGAAEAMATYKKHVEAYNLGDEAGHFGAYKDPLPCYYNLANSPVSRIKKSRYRQFEGGGYKIIIVGLNVVLDSSRRVAFIVDHEIVQPNGKTGSFSKGIVMVKEESGWRIWGELDRENCKCLPSLFDER